jgi:hypothetical protein
MHSIAQSLPLVLVLVIATSVHAQVSSGPQAGSDVAPLNVYAVTGNRGGGEADLAADREGKPTVYIFIQADKWDRPVGRFVKTLDQELAKSHPEVESIAVWLSDDVEKSKEYLPRAQQSLQFEKTALAVHPGDINGPEGWSINSDAFLTAVVAKDGKVVRSFAYRSVNETDVPDVLRALSN